MAIQQQQELPPANVSFLSWLGQKLPGPAKFFQEKVAPGFASFIESPFGAPLRIADDVANEVVRRPIATVAGTLQSLQAGQGFSPVDIYNQTSRELVPGASISMGQAVSTLLGQRLITRNPIIGGALRLAELDDDLYRYVPYLNPEFDIKDVQERKQAYLDSFYGSLSTGLGDVSLELLIGRGVGGGLRAARIASGLQRIPDAKTLAKEADEITQGRQAWIDQGKPAAPNQYRAPNGASEWVNNLYVTKDPKLLLNNPYVSNNPVVALLAAATDDWDTAAAIALATRGNAQALLALKKNQPAIADTLETELFPPPLKPLTNADDLKDFSGMADENGIANIRAVFADLVKKDPAYATHAEDLALSAYRGQIQNPSFAPSKFAAVERGKRKVADYLSLRYAAASKEGIEELMVGGGIFRPILSFHLRNLMFNPIGYLQLTGPFRKDPFDEVSAVFSNTKFLRDLEKDPTTRPLVQKVRDDAFRSLMLSLDETTRRASLEQVEANVMNLIVEQTKKKYKIPDSANIKATDLIKRTQEKRNMTIQTALDNDFVLDDVGVDVHVTGNLKSKLPNSFVMLDFNVFKDMIDDELKDFISLSSKMGNTNRLSRAIQMQGENLNSFFSAAVLIRPGYIPKNSIFEPMIRYQMETGKLVDMGLLLPATTNALRNAKGSFNAIVEGTSHMVMPSKRKLFNKTREERLKYVEDRNKIFKEDLMPIQARIKSLLEERKELFKDDIGLPKDMLDEAKAFNKMKLEEAASVERMYKDTVKQLDVIASQLSFKLPQAAKAAKRGTQESIMRRKKNVWLGDQGNVEFRAAGEDGGMTYLREVGDSAQGLYNSAGSTLLNRRMANLGSVETPIRGSKQYWESLDAEIERYSKSDPAGRATLEGQNVSQVAKKYWDEYQKLGVSSPLYRLVVAKRYAELHKGSPSLDELKVNQKDARFFAQEAKEFADMFLADPVLRQAALTRRIGQKELKERFENYEELPDLPSRFMPANATGLAKIINGTIAAQRKFFNALVKPEVSLFRYQLFDNAYEEGLKILGENVLAQGKSLTPAVMREIENAARQFATQKVTSTFYNVRRMNNYQYYSRFMLGFPTAMYNSLKFYGMTGLLNPYNFAILEQLRTTPWAVGTVVNDQNIMVSEDGFLIDDEGSYVDEFGNKSTNKVKNDSEVYMLLPTYKQVLDKITGKQAESGVQPYNRKINVRQFNFLTAGPSFSWFVQLPLKKIIASEPSIETTLKQALGEKGYGNLVFEGRVGPGFQSPSQEVTGLLQTLTPRFALDAVALSQLGIEELVSKEGDAIKFKTGPVATTVNMVHNARLANQQMSDPYNTEDPDMDSTIKSSYGILMSRLAEKVFSPLGITYQPQSQIYQDKLNQYRQYYTTYPEQTGGLSVDDAALYKLISENGDQVLSTMGFLVGSRERLTSVDFTQEVVRNLKKQFDSGLLERAVGENKQRINSLPIILEPTIPGEFSSAAYSFIDAFNKSGINLRGLPRDFTDMKAEAERRAGWYEYGKLQNLMNAKLSGRKSKDINAAENKDLLAERREKIYGEKGMAQLYPAWEEEWGGSMATPRFKSNMAVVEAALDDETFMSGLTGADKNKWEFIEAWYDEYSAIENDYLKSTNRTFRENVRNYWSNRTMQLIQANTYFADFHERWLTGDQIIDAANLTKNAKVVSTNPVTTSTPGASGGPSFVDRMAQKVQGG